MLLRLVGHEKDLGGDFRIQRLLPNLARRAVGPFVFFDHFGPLDFKTGMNIDVRPHPHIGLATVTFLFEGAMMHRDSLGSVQRIEPGAINWMSAGRGIVHSERTPDDLREVAHRLHGLQLWVALPLNQEESEPRFTHTPESLLAPFREQEAEVRILVGEGFGRRSPVEAASQTVFQIVKLKARSAFQLPPLAAELAVYPINDGLLVDGARLGMHTLGVLGEGLGCRLEALRDCTVVIIGGEPLDGPRLLKWNFVASTSARLESAARAWREQRLGSVPGETDFIPLPERILP